MSFLDLSSNASLDLLSPSAVMRPVKHKKAHPVSFRMGFYLDRTEFFVPTIISLQQLLQ